MKKFASNTLTISLDILASNCITKQQVCSGEYTQGYYLNRVTSERIMFYKHEMLHNKWCTIKTAIAMDSSPLYVASLPLVFLQDGTCYDGKHRLAAMALLTPTIRNIECAVIRGWNSTLPMPMGLDY